MIIVLKKKDLSDLQRLGVRNFEYSTRNRTWKLFVILFTSLNLNLNSIKISKINKTSEFHNSTIKRLTYPRQSLAIIVAHVLVGCYVSLGISRGARIYRTLAWTPKVIKKKKKRLIIRPFTINRLLINLSHTS